MGDDALVRGLISCNSIRSSLPGCNSPSPSFGHIIFPAFTIGLSAYIATLCVMWMRTGKEHYRELARFWTKIFAAAFAMGVASGLVLTYQFGTNWSRYSAVLGNVVGPMIGYEVEVAFFLEATFLGVLLFGWDRLPPWPHTLSAVV